MTEILCKWINDSNKFGERIGKSSFEITCVRYALIRIPYLQKPTSFRRSFLMDICLAKYYTNMACRFVECQWCIWPLQLNNGSS